MYPQDQPGGNPYDFIMNPGTNQQKRGLVGGGNSFVGKIVLIVGGAVVFMIVVAVLLSLFAGNKTNITDLTTLAETQNEIVRVAYIGTSGSATDQSVKNFATTTQFSVQTQQNQLVAYLGTLGTKVSAKQLGLKKDTTTDTKLNAALSNSTFDVAFTQELQNQLTDYAGTIKKMYAGSTSTKEKSLLKTDFEQVQLLLKQAPNTANLTQ